MKTKNILMSVLLAMGFIAAKAAGYPPELALVSQPVMVYNYNSITVYYDVQNIGDYTYRGDICLFLSPDNGYCYAEKYVKVCPGRIKRVAITIPAYRPNPSLAYMIMPYYEVGDELYSFTTFEYFEPLTFHWNGYHNEAWVVINVPPRVRYYTRPGIYRYYYDGFRPPMPPPHGVAHGPMTPPPPMNPMHHTYHYHCNNGGYPGNNGGNIPPAPNNGGGNSGGTAPQATVRPNVGSGSMSHGSDNSGNNTPASNSNSSGSMSRPNSNTGNNAGSVSGSNSGSSNTRPNSSGNVNRPNSNSNSDTVNNGSNSGRPNSSGNVSRPSSNSGNNSGTNSSGRTSNSSTGRVNNSNSNNRSSGTTNTSSSSGRSSNSSSSSSSRSNSNSGRGSR